MASYSGIRVRLVLLSFALLAPTLGLQLWHFADERRDAIARSHARVAELARAAATEEDDSLQEAANLLRVLRLVPSVAGMEDGACHALLREITNGHPRIDGLSVIRADGMLACNSTQPVPRAITFADRTWFQEVTADNAPATVTSGLLVSRQSGQPTVVVATALPSPAHQRPGSLAAGMNLGWFSAIAARISDADGATVQILDVRDATVLASSTDPARWVGRRLPDHALTRRIQPAAHGTVEMEGYDGVVRITGFSRLPGDQNWPAVVLVGVPRDVVLAEANRQLAIGLALTGLMLAAGFLAAWALAGIAIVRPLEALGQVAQRLGAGDLSARAATPAHSIRELRKLGQTLNAAAAMIEAHDRQLEAIASRDALTGLANRRSFDIALAREWLRAGRGGSPLSLLMIDVDHFKRYNDSYGHPAGDECLRRVASAIGGVVRSASDVAARYGGEEIAVILPETDLAGAAVIGRRIVDMVEGLELPHAGSPFGRVTVSVGIASMLPGAGPDAGTDDPEALTRVADGALYRAKQNGRSQAVTAAPASLCATA